MNRDALDEVLSSNVRLRIEDALAVRPRTLGELASITGISVQGVLKQLHRLGGLGLVVERTLPLKTLKARRVYAATGQLVGDYSTPDLTVVKPTGLIPPSRPRRLGDLEERAAEVTLLRRRVEDQADRLGRMIDSLVDEREALKGELDALQVGPLQRIILEVLLTEETIQDGVKVLQRHYGIEDRRSIDEALAVARRSVPK